MNALFQKKLEIPLLVALLVVAAIIVILASALSVSVNEPASVLILPGAAGRSPGLPEGAGLQESGTWNIIYIDVEVGQEANRFWTCANPDDPQFSNWIIYDTYTGTMGECILSIQ